MTVGNLAITPQIAEALNDAEQLTLEDAHLVTHLRPFGLCAGEFVVPDDFDDPLPAEILKLFEKEHPCDSD